MWRRLESRKEVNVEKDDLIEKSSEGNESKVYSLRRQEGSGAGGERLLFDKKSSLCHLSRWKVEGLWEPQLG